MTNPLTGGVYTQPASTFDPAKLDADMKQNLAQMMEKAAQAAEVEARVDAATRDNRTIQITVTGTDGVERSTTVSFDFGMSIEDQMAAIQMVRAQMLDNQLQDQIIEIKAKNDYIKELSDLLAQAKALAPKSDKEDDWYLTPELREKFAALGFGDETRFTDASCGNMGEWQSFTEKVKSSIDSANSSSQQFMLRLQNLSSRRNEAYDTVSNFYAKMQKSRENVVSNTR